MEAKGQAVLDVAGTASQPPNKNKGDSKPKSQSDSTDKEAKPSGPIVIDCSNTTIQLRYGTVKPKTGSLMDKSTEWAEVVDINQPADEFYELCPDAKSWWPFELDTFQKQAIISFIKGYNVFVAAHTSAGKTVVAEYVIRMALENQAKVAYTSPIKALSNQKYFDFKQTWNKPKEVGIVTGDVQVDSDARCVIMTAEILLKMLVQGDNTAYEYDYVIFDEVHYVNDPSRGHVWEQIFIQLPPTTQLVLLSATVPNVVEFADWLGRIREKVTRVIYTLKRPTPLEHHLFIGKCTGAKKEATKLFKIVDASSKFQDNEYKKADQLFKENLSSRQKHFGPKARHGPLAMPQNAERQLYINLVRFLVQEDKLPVIVFAFSRQRSEKYAHMLNCEDLTTRDEKFQIYKFFRKAIRRLKKHDRALPQVQSIIQLCKRGIAVHNSGILPFLKEAIEILFSKGLIKVLFATETFAMGINMPARCVVFDSIRKHDGIHFRELLSSEYIQMAGRAGRRGKDATGTCIILCKNDVPQAMDLREMMLGKATSLESQFRLTYGMILNMLLGQDESKIEVLLRQSFAEHASLKTVEAERERQKDLKTKLQGMKLPECDLCFKKAEPAKIPYADAQRLSRMAKATKLVIDPQAGLESFCSMFFSEYRTALEKINPMILSRMCDRRMLKPGLLLVIMDVEYRPAELASLIRYHKDENNIELSVVNQYGEQKKISSSQVHFACKTTLDLKLPASSSPLSDAQISQITEKLKPFWERFGNHPLGLFELEEINTFHELNLKDLDFVDLKSKVDSLRKGLIQYRCLECFDFPAHYQKAKDRALLAYEIECIARKLSAESLQHLPDYRSRIMVLKELGFLNEDESLTEKGRIACCFAEHELLLTNLVFENVFQGLDSPSIPAIFAPFSSDAKSQYQNEIYNEVPIIKEKIDLVLDLARIISESEYQNYVTNGRDDYVQSLKLGLVDFVYHWANGKTFKDCMQYTDLQEGIIVRSLQRLEEILKDVASACHSLGAMEKEETVNQCITAIHKDILTTGSLYIDDESLKYEEGEEEESEEISESDIYNFQFA